MLMFASFGGAIGGATAHNQPKEPINQTTHIHSTLRGKQTIHKLLSISFVHSLIALGGPARVRSLLHSSTKINFLHFFINHERKFYFLMLNSAVHSIYCYNIISSFTHQFLSKKLLNSKRNESYFISLNEGNGVEWNSELLPPSNQ